MKEAKGAMGVTVTNPSPRVGRRFIWTRAAALALVFAAGCAGAPVVTPPPASVADAQQSFDADIAYCQLVRSSRMSTLGPTIFQPISGDESFNECVTRAKTNLDMAVLEVQ